MAKIPFKAPNLGNMSAGDIADELGKVKCARKTLDKLEEYYKTALKARLDGKTEISGSSFVANITKSMRVALDQEKAKHYFEVIGKLPEYMKETETETLRVEDKLGGDPVDVKDLVEVLEYVLSSTA